MGGTRDDPGGCAPSPLVIVDQEVDATDASDLERQDWTLKSRGLRPELTLYKSER